ncbi:minichromosome maintenance protein MCM [archaeon]|jgi:replicative DNA helicase Mcm|nr:minichromosome maintenance protein MCM [archaeon]MBT6402026.1 minichromosome maintenance protein MCM [Candidatus Woesearchaeota archaeon]MBT3730532.1 minichromosome maintenance protein MCM [archaeon]MBT4669402.1 minichromosome maintenance protein MCM [archaeon]MBT5029845.1 minichromosome maintenance protein MCM [archaeon]
MTLDASEQMEKFQDFVEQSYQKDLHENVSKGYDFLVLDFFELTKFDPRLADQLLEEPEETLKAAEIALEQFDVRKGFRIRFRNLPKSQEIFIRNLRSKHLDKFIAIEGIIRQSSEVRPQAVSAKFECPSCGNVITMPQIDQQFREPTRCTCGRKGKFRLLSKTLVDVQRLVIEESPENLEGGAQPKRMQVFLREDLVEPRMEKRSTPGTRVLVSGMMYEVPIQTRTGATSTRFDLAMTANYVEPIEEDYSEIVISPEDEKEIRALSKDKKIYERLVASISPSIFGHDKIKEAIMLQLFGGIRKTKKDGTIIRGDLHVLLVGDPGCGKSQMLTFVNKSAPKARYVAGRSASGAGLTASVVKDEFLRGWALEAGAMVLADKGVLVLDEMDKISTEDTSALHEAMEQQHISIAKANIQATLRTQTSILAAANPKMGRFDPFTPVPNQIDLPPALINRFDLIFVMRDLPNKELDTNIATRVLESHSYKEPAPDIDSKMLRKFLAFTRQKCFPKLTDEAIKEIKEFYVDLRSSGSDGDNAIKPIPISPRQLEAIVRLAEASARIKLKDKVEKEDALRAIALLKGCMAAIGIDPETGKVDMDRITTGITASTRGRILEVRNLIFELCDEKDGPVSVEEDLKPKVYEKGVTEQKLEEAIEKLKRSGDIFEPKKGWLQKI